MSTSASRELWVWSEHFLNSEIEVIESKNIRTLEIIKTIVMYFYSY